MLLFSRYLILLFIITFLKSQTPNRFALKASDSGEISYFNEGLKSNIVSEIRLMGDSLTWFGTGRGLSVNNKVSTYTYEFTEDTLKNIISNPLAKTSRLPAGGVSGISVSNDTMAVAFAGDDNNTPVGLGIAVCFKSESWYEIPPEQQYQTSFIWDSLGVKTLNTIELGANALFNNISGYNATYLLINSQNNNIIKTLLDSIQIGNQIRIENVGLSKILIFSVDSYISKTENELQINITQGSLIFNSDLELGFNQNEAISLIINKRTKSLEWSYINQPVDNDIDTLNIFGEGYFRQLPVTVSQANVTYDMDISGKYLWLASWAGGLRRFDISRNSIRKAENIPLPMDGQLGLSTCQDSAFINIGGKPILKDFYLNPRDPVDGGNHNHKAFSVLAYGDTVWVGTANGINRGITIEEIGIDSTGSLTALNCIDWEHYKFPTDGLSGNFVVALAKQRWRNQNIIWAATLGAGDLGEFQGVSYTRDNGITWESTLIGERAYNIQAKDSLVFVATANGLWKSLDGENWAIFEPGVEKDSQYQKEILNNIVYSIAIENRDSVSKVWVGTPDGIGLSNNIHGNDWNIFQAEYDAKKVYAYPNPFSPFTHNQINNDGYVRFHTGSIANNIVKIDIFNFSMEKVISQEYNLSNHQGALKWDGRDNSGKHVSNGVYFIRINFSTSLNKSTEDKWTKLVVVK